MTKNTTVKKAAAAAKKAGKVLKFTVGCPKCGHVHADGRNRACRSTEACKARRAA